MISEDVLKKAVWQIHNCPELAGCVVGYWGDNICRTIGYPSCVTLNSENVAVVIEEVVLPEEAPPLPQTEATAAPPPPQVKRALNKTKLWPELIGAGASCGLFGVSVLGFTGGVAAEVPTGGASTFLVVAAWGGMIAGGIQCANGLVRVGHLVTNWETDSLAQWDDNDTYKIAIQFVDAVGVGSGIAALPFQARNLWAVATRLRSLRTADLSIEALKRMNQRERFQAIARAFRDASRTPEGAQALVAAARELKQIGPKTFQQASRLSVNHSLLLKKIINKETIVRLKASLTDVFAGVAGVALSGTPSEWTGSGSGVVNEYGSKGIAYVVNLLDAGAPNF